MKGEHAMNLPMKSTAPFTKQTILSINTQKQIPPKTFQTISDINHITSNVDYVSAAPQPALSAQTIPALKNPITKGQKVSLETGNVIKAKLGWNVLNEQCDADVSAFLLNSEEKVIGDNWFVFYGQTESPDKSVCFSYAQNDGRELITIDFTKLNPAVKKIVFVLTINEALQKNLNFGMLKDAYIRITDASTDRELVSFQLTDYYSNVISMMIGELYFYQGNWKFNAVGNGVAKDLAGLCERYGVEVE